MSVLSGFIGAGLFYLLIATLRGVFAWWWARVWLRKRWPCACPAGILGPLEVHLQPCRLCGDSGRFSLMDVKIADDAGLFVEDGVFDRTVEAMGWRRWLP